MRLRLQGREVYRAALGVDSGWPIVSEPVSQQAWEISCEQAFRVNQEQADLVIALTDHDLARHYAESKALRSQMVHGVIGHNCYQSCEIENARHMLSFWLERT